MREARAGAFLPAGAEPDSMGGASAGDGQAA